MTLTAFINLLFLVIQKFVKQFMKISFWEKILAIKKNAHVKVTKMTLKLHKKNLHSEALQMPPTKVLTLQSTTGPLQFSVPYAQLCASQKIWVLPD